MKPAFHRCRHFAFDWYCKLAVTLFEHPFLVMDTDFQLQENGGLVGLPCDRALSKACSLTAARSTWNDILTQTYPQMYMLYKNTLKFLLLSMNMTFKAVSYVLKEESASYPLLFLSKQTQGRQENNVLKTISPLKGVTRHLVFLFIGDRATFNQSFEKFLPRFLQIMSGWSLLLGED